MSDLKTSERACRWEIPLSGVVTFTYRNYRGEVSVRRAIPLKLWYGITSYHSEHQFILDCWDVDKGSYRSFALRDIQIGGEEERKSAADVEGQPHSQPTDLVAYLRSHQCRGFAVKPFYNRAGDSLTVFFADTECVAENRGNGVTVYRRCATSEVVGVRIDGMRALVLGEGE